MRGAREGPSADEALVANMEKMVNEDLNSTAKHAGIFELRSRPRRCPSTLLPPRARR
jgi:hypothetical protein